MIFRSKFGLPEFHVSFDQTIPEHVGLGSKTASLMALARAVSSHFGLGLGYVELARLVRRGGTSGVGIHASELGGIVVDDGHEYPNEKCSFVPSSASAAFPPSLVVSSAAPEGCEIVHVRLDGVGLSGADEQLFFSKHCPIPESETRRLLEVVETGLMPSIESGCLREINDSLRLLQDLGLKAREWAAQEPETKRLRERWDSLSGRRALAIPPLCLSSMGPTVFILTDEPRAAVSRLLRLDVPRDLIVVSKPCASGSVIQTGTA